MAHIQKVHPPGNPWRGTTLSNLIAPRCEPLGVILGAADRSSFRLFRPRMTDASGAAGLAASRGRDANAGSERLSPKF